MRHKLLVNTRFEKRKLPGMSYYLLSVKVWLHMITHPDRIPIVLEAGSVMASKDNFSCYCRYTQAWAHCAAFAGVF